jgi:hypothetical protein
MPVEQGGVIDEIPGLGHPAGNQHTGGTPDRHPNTSIFNGKDIDGKRDGTSQRAREIYKHWREKGKRLKAGMEGEWVDPDGTD